MPPCNELDADRAVLGHVRPGDTVLLGSGAGEAVRLQEALVRHAADLPGLTLIGGLQLGDYPFLEPVRAGHWSYRTWHVMPPVRRDVAAGLVEFLPVRGATLPRLIDAVAPDVFLGAASRPVGGRVSFGASTSYALPAAARASRVLLETNARMPFTRGRSSIPTSAATALVEVDAPLPAHRATAGEVEPEVARIAELVRALLPAGTVLQTGIGRLSEEVLRLLDDDPPDDLTFFGMGTDAMVAALRAGRSRLVGGELLGTEILYDLAHDDERVTMYPAADITAVPRAAERAGLVSLNTAIEIDLRGQVNSESVRGAQVSGVGGAFDFADASWFSAGGTSIVAMTSRQGSRSRIVPRLAEECAVSVPRHSVRHVVTEYGAVDLFPLSDRERAEALVGLAHPDDRDALAGHRTRGVA